MCIRDRSWQRLRRSAVDFYSKHGKNRSLSHPLGHLGVTYALHLWLVGKPGVNFIFVVIGLFSLFPTVETNLAYTSSAGLPHYTVAKLEAETQVWRRPNPKPGFRNWRPGLKSQALYIGYMREFSSISHMLPLSPLKGGSKSDFSFFWVKVNGWSSQALST